MEILDNYAKLVAQRPYELLAVAVIAVGLITTGAFNIDTVEQSNEDLLPDDIPSVEAFDTVSQDFGAGAGGETYTILLETEGSYENTTEIDDVRDPEMLKFVEKLHSDLAEYNHITQVSSAADLVESPSTTRQASQQLERTGQKNRYISEDRSFTIIEVTTTDIDQEEAETLAEEIQYSVNSLGTPPGVEARYTGTVFIDQAFQDEAGQTQAITGILSFLGVLVVVMLLFRSIYQGLSSLIALVIGITAGFGLFGWLGFNINPATSGAASMGIGIAIDFGIQTVNRYREEREKHQLEKALSKTLNGVIKPISIALLAALIGFISLSLGQITFLTELGTILSLITLLAFIGAITIIPIALSIHDRWNQK